MLAGRGFEPTRVDDGLVLRNCPFDALAREHTALVCGVNRDYVGGVLDGLGCDHTSARLDPGPDRCCVRVEESTGRSAGPDHPPARMTGMGNSRLAYVGVPLVLVAGSALAACSETTSTPTRSRRSTPW